MTRSSVRTAAATFHSEDVVAPARPTGTIVIGTGTYAVRAPKYQIWWDVVSMLEGNELGGAAIERLTAEADQLSPAEARELMEQASFITSMESMHVAVIYGVEDPTTHRVRGGFLRQCLAKDDWQTLMDEIDDDDADLDLPDLYQAAMALQAQFTPWFMARSDAMGLPAPKPTLPPRKTTAKRKG